MANATAIRDEVIRNGIALTPWQTGTMYPCQWAQDKDVDPRRGFEKARMVAELPVEQIHASWPFPDGENLPERVPSAVLLPHKPPAPPITVIDFDDVRDPETGAVTEEVLALVNELGGHTEVSSSGEGLHVFVRAGLPDDVATFSAGLQDRGRLEVYDHSRFVATTWMHVERRPLDEVPIAGAAVDALLDTYSTDTHRAGARAGAD